ncbi:MAG: hypothetical protein M0Q21_09565 [Ignavibacteriaceae bacterium]|nr:hypothetical protein [Ignavibacteriaceae bacterium]
MQKYFLLFILLFITVRFSNGQNENHNWKPLIINDAQRIWYDRSQLDTINNPAFDIWILEMHRPTLSLEGISDNIMRTKTLYIVDLQSYKYGIKKVLYYDPSNQLIKSFQYNTNSITEEYKFIFPIMENSFMQKVIDELLRLRKLKESLK